VVAQRQRTRLEHLIGEGKEHHGLDRADGRGVERLDQQIKLTAVVQNLKRLLTALTRRRRGSPVPKPAQGSVDLDLRGRLLGESPPLPPFAGVSRPIRERLWLAGPDRPVQPAGMPVRALMAFRRAANRLWKDRLLARRSVSPTIADHPRDRGWLRRSVAP
jgi:hypothetical protein